MYFPICRLAGIVLLALVACVTSANDTTTPNRQKSEIATNPHIVFFNPGYSSPDNPTGEFWPKSSRFAEAVAADLGIQLEIFHARRNYLRMQRQIAQVLEREKSPDYLLLVNERYSLTPLIGDINRAGIPFFFAYNHLLRPDSPRSEIPRKRYRNWLGALVPNNHYAGYLLAEQLIRSVEPAPARILVLAGDNITSAAQLREQGLIQALDKHPEASISQRLVGEWGYALPQKQVPGILRRLPDINIIWSANGPMAMGALDGLQSSAQNRKPPSTGSINWDRGEIDALKRGELNVSIGGHFMTAGISLILLHDYHRGFDFADDGGLYQQRDLFYPITQENADNSPLLDPRLWQQMDFSHLSKALNHSRRQYDFSLDTLEKLKH